MTLKEQILTVAVIALIVVVAVLLIFIVRIPSGGRIRAIGCQVYADENCTREISYIDWGTLDPGEIRNQLVYIKNTKTVNFTLALSTENWNPLNADNYISLAWNYTGEVVVSKQVIPVVLTLTVSSDVIIDSFSFDIVITATEESST